MPAMHLISVDLPAPLSPTSAITSPERTSKSTSVNASTEPKLLRMPRASSVGVSEAMVVGVDSAVAVIGATVEGAPEGALDVVSCLLAELRVLPAADLALLEVAVEELL